MKMKEVQLGKVYLAKVSESLSPVRIDSVSPYGGWQGTNMSTNREVRVRTAQRLRGELERNPATGKWRRIVAVDPGQQSSPVNNDHNRCG